MNVKECQLFTKLELQGLQASTYFFKNQMQKLVLFMI